MSTVTITRGRHHAVPALWRQVVRNEHGRIDRGSDHAPMSPDELLQAVTQLELYEGLLRTHRGTAEQRDRLIGRVSQLRAALDR
ncbi:hypothetical protein [Kribbella deserti]|uniref:Uncharacterized protein n=1 Tax=Kribbella deserti TaxID=1926257 RepID=A0ABV6QIS4_9ACTN